jgi:hypothetical protein
MMLQGYDAVKSRSTGRGGGKEVVVEKEGKILTALLRDKIMLPAGNMY